MILNNNFVISLCSNLMEEQIGDISDLPQELANTIANIYLRHCYYIIYYDSGLDHVIVPDELKETKDLVKGMKKYASNRVFIDTAVRSLPEVIDSLRDIEEEDNDHYNYSVELMLDIYKYNINDALNKSSIRRKIERKFCKVNEIPNLIDKITDNYS